MRLLLKTTGEASRAGKPELARDTIARVIKVDGDRAAELALRAVGNDPSAADAKIDLWELLGMDAAFAVLAECDRTDAADYFGSGEASDKTAAINCLLESASRNGYLKDAERLLDFLAPGHRLHTLAGVKLENAIAKLMEANV